MHATDMVPASGHGELPATSARREALHTFVHRHRWMWEGTMAALAAIYVALGFWNEQEGGSVPETYLTVLAVVFVAEFLARLWASPNRLGYVKRHWVDLVTAVPMLGPLRALRLLRLLKLSAAFRVIATADRVSGRTRTSLWFLGPALITLWVGSAYAFWVVESGSNPSVHNFGSALYMSFATVTTFGYTDAHPVTPAGQVLAGLLIFAGIGLVTFASSQLTNRLLHNTDTNDLIRHEIGSLRSEIESLRAMLAVSAAAVVADLD